MTKAVLISKNYKGSLDDVVERDGSLRNISGRCSGDTTGYVLLLVGRLMKKDYAYTISTSDIVQEIGCKGLEARRILYQAGLLINNLGYRYFNLSCKESISYEPWL